MSNHEAVQLYQQAESLKAQGRLSEAAANYRSALEHDPQALALWWALGDLYAQMENFSGVEGCCKEILARNPGIAEAHLYLGIALQRQDQLEDAESALQMSLRLNPDLAEGFYQLAIVQQSLGQIDAAIENYRKALTAKQDPAPALYNLGILYQRQGQIEEAYSHAVAAVQAEPASLKYRQLFIRLLNELSPIEVSTEVMAEILRCFDMPGLDVAPLMKPGMRLLAADPVIQRAVNFARQMPIEEFSREVVQGGCNSLFTNQLLHKLLLHTKISSPEFETLLYAMRRSVLDSAAQKAIQKSNGAPDAAPGFLEALACHFFNTEYAAFVTPDEAATINALAEELTKSIAQNKLSNRESMVQLAVYCMYRPLSSLEGIGSVLDKPDDPLHASLPLIVERQWADYQSESALRDKIETITPIETGISTVVREQYEDSPYPRWFSVDMYQPISFRESLHAQFPWFEAPDFNQSPINVLVAGCGTGRHAIMLASHLADTEMLAVDLSKASLAYAKRKADEMGLTNIRFAQADILKLGSLEQKFHIIESVGVLHHMQEPQVGLNVLTELLVDGGLMRLGLYSAYGRRAIAAARQHIAEQGFEATPDGIRAARQALLALDAGHPAIPAMRFRDFYTLSECRDLLFHVQEHRLRIPDLIALLKDCGLTFVGFVFTSMHVPRLYQEQYPNDPAMTNLANWDEFERAYPDTFEEMYQFWCQKA